MSEEGSIQGMSEQIIDLAQWFHTPAGRYLREWELRHCDQAVADCFGYHALQIGGETLPLLRNSRVKRRWLAGIETPEPALAADHGLPVEVPQEVDATLADELDAEVCIGELAHEGQIPLSLVVEPMALPFAENSLDLVVLPHTLEASADPHATLREVERVLVPEGRLIVIGFNPVSLWGTQQWRSVLAQRMGSGAPAFIPDIDDLIGHRRLRDWLRLLNLEVDGGRFGCYRPGLRSEAWYERLRWMEHAGDRWWPILGGVYFIEAVKRVRGVRMIQPRWKVAKQARSTVPLAQGERHATHCAPPSAPPPHTRP